MCFTLAPLSDIRVIIDPFPYSMSMLEPLAPLSVIDLFICPGIDPISMCFSYLKMPKVSIAIVPSFKPFSISNILHPFPFILSAISIFHYAKAMSLAIYHNTYVNSFFKWFLDKAGEIT